MRRQVILLLHFLVDVLVAAVMFMAVLGADYLLWSMTEMMQTRGIPDLIITVAHYLAYLIFALDVLCVVFLVCVAAFKLIREVIASLKDDGTHES